ncbi:MAG: flagellar basal-body MS-ring/collar protein FliF [Moraxellaceae bacterium]|nr:flagellar basal-body MS-ring/collar protein FliF [Moraxellaceae bacterium]
MAEDVLAAPPPSPFQTMADNFNKLTPRQRMAGAVALALAVALLVGVWLWSRQPQYSVLFSNLAEKDGGAIVTSLQAQNVPYRVEANGATILVPSDRANELRLLLASQGLPKGGLVGFELMEGQKLGISQFHEQINYQRGLEGELARTIQSLAAVGGARVHLAIPKQTAFLRDEEKPTASVVVNLHPGRNLEPAQVAGIVHLVSSSVPKLAAEAVSVIDQRGNLLTQKRDARLAALDPTQLQYVEEVEAAYIKRVQNILMPLLGEPNFRVQVAADVDFDATEQTSETYGPNPPPNTAIRSQQTVDNQTNQPPAAGVPGALSNQPPVPATAPITTPQVPPGSASGPVPLTTNKSATTNYELDKTIQHVRRSLGNVKRLSVAVVVNHKSERNPRGDVQMTPLPEAELQRITALVREAVGFSEQRGDTLNVANAAFTEAPGPEVITISWWKDPEILALLKEAARWLVLLGVIAFVAFGVLRPLLRTVMPVPTKEEEEAEAEREAAAAAAAAAAEAAGAEGETKEPGEDDIPPEVLEAELAKMSFEKKVARARDIAAKDPRIVAQLIKTWLNGGAGAEERR